MKLRKRNIDIEKLILIIFVTCSLMPTLFLLENQILKPMYLMFVLMLLQMMRRGRIAFPNYRLCIFWGLAITISLLASVQWKVERYFFNYCFGFVVVIVFISLYQDYSRTDWIGVLQTVWWICLVCIIINNLKQYDKFIYYFAAGTDHPYIVTLINGGVNIEATWLAVLSVVFFDNRKRWIPFGLSCGLSILYKSRAGMIIDAVVFCIFFFGRMPADTRKKIFRRRIWLTILIIIAAGGIAMTSTQYVLDTIERFTHIGNESGSLGRLAMWRYAIPTLVKYPLGVGLGNSISALETISPLRYTENNMHCLYMQMFIDLGVIGGTVYLMIWGAFAKRELKNISKNPLCAVVFLYGISAFLEFGGGETMFFCALGIFLNDRRNNKVEKAYV